MTLPNGHLAVVEDAKLHGYVLNPAHPVGRHHAVLFDTLLGISLRNADVLKEALLSAATEEEVFREHASPYGRKYEMRFPIVGPKGEKAVRAVWIVDEGGNRPRLVTCYVE